MKMCGTPYVLMEKCHAPIQTLSAENLEFSHQNPKMELTCAKTTNLCFQNPDMSRKISKS